MQGFPNKGKGRGELEILHGSGGFFYCVKRTKSMKLEQKWNSSNVIQWEKLTFGDGSGGGVE